ncbi:unnamed protein product [Rotaria magnacalcarata]|uniref:Uncharacterized protein n=1 Tax=Rotaria magnacalcarata TaxID=392030 RepID=A0A818WY44_9BILA|nr:unnamed protein product [Rotaria magnacalcarata]
MPFFNVINDVVFDCCRHHHTIGYKVEKRKVEEKKKELDFGLYSLTPSSPSSSSSSSSSSTSSTSSSSSSSSSSLLLWLFI